MDIGRMSMAFSQNSLQNAVQLSVMKLQMNSTSDMATGLKDMMDNMAVDTDLGKVIDVKA